MTWLLGRFLLILAPCLKYLWAGRRFIAFGFHINKTGLTCIYFNDRKRLFIHLSQKKTQPSVRGNAHLFKDLRQETETYLNSMYVKFHMRHGTVIFCPNKINLTRGVFVLIVKPRIGSVYFLTWSFPFVIFLWFWFYVPFDIFCHLKHVHSKRGQDIHSLITIFSHTDSRIFICHLDFKIKVSQNPF